MNESLGTTAVIQPHVFLARKAEAHSGEVTLWRAMAAMLRGHEDTQAKVGERIPQRLPAASSNRPSSNCIRRQGHVLSPVKKGQARLWASWVPRAHPGTPVRTTGSSAFLHRWVGSHIQTRGVQREERASLLESFVRSKGRFARSPPADSSARVGSRDSPQLTHC